MAITTLRKVKKHCKLGNSIYSSYCKRLISFTHKEFLKINKQKKKKKDKKDYQNRQMCSHRTGNIHGPEFMKRCSAFLLIQKRRDSTEVSVPPVTLAGVGAFRSTASARAGSSRHSSTLPWAWQSAVFVSEGSLEISVVLTKA